MTRRLRTWRRALRTGVAAAAAAFTSLAAHAQFTAPRVVAFADVHGAYTELTTLLREAGVVDAQLRWAAGHTHLVSLGDLLDRGADSRQVMDLLMRLQTEAEAAGGRVHVVLGNHEAMNLLGDLRYVHPGEYAAYAELESPAERDAARQTWLAAKGLPEDFERRFPRGYFGHRAAFAPQGPYGRWLLGLPVALSVNDTLFMHAGPSQLLQGLSLAELNLRYRTALVEAIGRAQQAQQALLLQPGDGFALRARLSAAWAHPMLSVQGPNWYRGPALCREAVETDVLLPVLQQHGAARLVVGHTVARGGEPATRMLGRVVKLDAGMNRQAYEGRAATLLLQDSQALVRLAGDAAPRPLTPEPLFVAPDEFSDAQVQAALAVGELTVSGPRGPNELAVSVAHGAMRIPAVFRVRTPDEVKRELAAHRLDRLLGLGLVPATAARQWQGQAGVLQARPAQWLTQAELEREPARPRGEWCDLPRQHQLLQAFDALLGLQGLKARRADTLLLDSRSWTVLATGHEQAFGTGAAVLGGAASAVGPELRRRLAGLQAKDLQDALGTWLDDPARAALLARRDALLATPAAATTGAR